MSNDKLFRALSSPTRIKILKILLQEEIHVTGLARKLGISVPVTSRHIKILNEVGLINIRVFGNIYLLASKLKDLETIFEPFIHESEVIIEKKKSILDALKQIPGIEIKKMESNYYIKSIDGDKGFFIYEVDGKLPNKSIDKYIINKNIKIDIKKLISVKKRGIKVEIKE
jgi:DNA-binding transcriptional ArsR family regulator